MNNKLSRKKITLKISQKKNQQSLLQKFITLNIFRFTWQEMKVGTLLCKTIGNFLSKLMKSTKSFQTSNKRTNYGLERLWKDRVLIIKRYSYSLSSIFPWLANTSSKSSWFPFFPPKSVTLLSVLSTMISQKNKYIVGILYTSKVILTLIEGST